MAVVKRGLLVVVAVLLLAGPAQPQADGPLPLAEVVVTLDAPPLAQARARRTTFSRSQRLRLRAPASVSYLDALASQPRRLETRIGGAPPGGRPAPPGAQGAAIKGFNLPPS